MKKIIFLYSKDAMSIENLPLFGNQYWKTPNLDELAEKGTVFYNHHTSAASTSMVFSSMLTGEYCHTFEKRKRYTSVEPNEKESIFSILQKEGYKCHIIWSPDYMRGAYPYVREFGDESKTKIHIVEMQQQSGVHRPKNVTLKRNDDLLNLTINKIYTELNSIEDSEKLFIWLHLPHVIRGRCCYGDDIDVFDSILGFIRKKYGDENIYVTADHGHMNMHKDIPGYGFHVYEPTCRVPLIAPRINDIARVDHITSHVDLIRLLLNDEIVKRDYVFVDSQYYAQPDRKFAVISDRYKYIYNKRTDSEEFYDLNWDPQERFNLLEKERFDKDKKVLRRITELYFYPYWDTVEANAAKLRAEKDKIWKVGTFREELEFKLRNDYTKLKMWLKSIKQMRG